MTEDDRHFFISLLQIGWYNDHVTEPFRLSYPYDTLALCIISTPEMFDKGFKPFLKTHSYSGSMDPMDEFISDYLNKLKAAFPNEEMEIIFDYELLPNRRPKILVQTAGHVSGAAFYYRRENVKNDPWAESAKIFGVSIHRKYGGWFGFRGVVIFKNVQTPELENQPAVDVVSEDDKIIELLEKFNYHWRDWKFRDIIPVVMKYSEEQKLYFDTPPAERRKLLQEYINCP